MAARRRRDAPGTPGSRRRGHAPTTLTATNLAGYLYLAVVGTALAYMLWFRGIQALPVTGVTFLGLLSPLVATGLGCLVLGQAFSPAQALGGLIVLVALVAAQSGATTLPLAAVRKRCRLWWMT